MTLFCLCQGKDKKGEDRKREKGSTAGGHSKKESKKAEIASSSATPTMTTATTTTTTATATRRIEPRGEASILALALAESPEEEERVLPDLLREMQEAEMQARRLKTTLKRSPRAKGPSSGAASAGT
ncbi:hypothetical protein PLICBS_007080 [Purpureocillium lilacinum]|nr:hypothetical protein PLICBS_007080 [Purpureocillium lilacinum]